MFYHFRLLFLVALLLGMAKMNATEQRFTKENPVKVGQVIGKIMKKPTSFISLLLVAGYWRCVTKRYCLVAIGRIIYNYAHGGNDYPYKAVKLVSNELIKEDEYSSYDSPTYLQVREDTSVMIGHGVIHFIHYATDTDIRNAPLPSHPFVKNEQDRPVELILLQEEAPCFSFVVLSQAGYITYVTSQDGAFIPSGIMLVDDFSNLDHPADQISFYVLNQPSAFLVLVNTPIPTLIFYKIVQKSRGKQAVWAMPFDTSNWYKNGNNSFVNLCFLDDYHFVLLNHHPALGSRLFLYTLKRESALGYISFDKKYNCLHKFSYDSLCLYSHVEPCMMIFDHHTQSFIRVLGKMKKCVMITLANTRQVIMDYVGSEVVDKDDEKTGKLFLCNVNKDGISIQDEFKLEKLGASSQLVSVACQELGNHSLGFFLNPIDQPHDHLYYSWQTFTLLKSKNANILSTTC